MRVIILAAGQGMRLRPLTNDRPKCLVELQGKSLLDHQLDVLISAGITDLHIILGYRAAQVRRLGITRHLNPAFATTNMVSTLFSSADLLDGSQDILVTYGDIVYEARVLEALLDSNAPISLGVDTEWRRFWEARMDNPLSDAETLKLVDGNRVIELGKKPRSYDEVQGQYMGLIKINKDWVVAFRETWERMDRSALYDGKDFKNMFMTSFLQHLINNGWDTRAVFTANGWLEIDVPKDLNFDVSRFWKQHGTA